MSRSCQLRKRLDCAKALTSDPGINVTTRNRANWFYVFISIEGLEEGAQHLSFGFIWHWPNLIMLFKSGALVMLRI